MSLLLQDVVVTGMALGAIVVLYRRIAGVVAPPPGKGGCASCQAGVGINFNSRNPGRALSAQSGDPRAQGETRARGAAGHSGM
jgi:hypothetical protein